MHVSLSADDEKHTRQNLRATIERGYQQSEASVWGRIFAEHGRVFEDPHSSMEEVVRCLLDIHGSRVIDLGCGTGRHVVLLAKRGFTVFGMDDSVEALNLAAEWLKPEGLPGHLIRASMHASLPFPDASVDAVLAVQTIHHGRLATILETLREIRRVLRPGGRFFLTVPAQRDQGSQFSEVEANTWIPLDGPEKGLPHHYFDPGEFRSVLEGFDIQWLRLDETQHHCVLAYRVPSGMGSA